MVDEANKLLDAAGKAIETVPDLYDDSLKPTVQESGKVLSLIPRAMYAALAPLRKWIANQEYVVAETEKLLAKKLEHVGVEKIVTPEAYVAVPAIQAISYSMDNEELRELYANLLAKSMSIDTKDQVHPVFVEIIKQMSPLDAAIFKKISQLKEIAVIDLCIRQSTKIYIPTITSLESSLENVSHDLIGVSFDNLLRLKLIDKMPFVDTVSKEFTTEHVSEKDYALIRETEYYTDIRNWFDHLDSLAGSGFTMTFIENKNIFKTTDLGQLFFNICVTE